MPSQCAIKNSRHTRTRLEQLATPKEHLNKCDLQPKRERNSLIRLSWNLRSGTCSDNP